MPVAGVAEAVVDHVPAGPDRAGHRGQHVPGRLVADVDDLAQRLGDRVVAPRGDLVVAAVAPPRVPGAGRGRVEPERRVGDDVRPGRRGVPALLENGDVLRAVRGEPAVPVEERHPVGHRRRRDLRRGGPGHAGGPAGRVVGEGRRGQQGQLRGEVPAAGVEDDAGGGGDRRKRLGGGLVGAEQEDPSRRVGRAGAGLDRDHEVFEALLQVLGVARRVQVDDDEVDREPPQPPELERPHHLPDQRQLAGVRDVDDHDRQVAGDAERPERALGGGLGDDQVLVGAQHRVRVEHVPGQRLELVGLVGADAEVPQLDLGLGPAEGGDAVVRGGGPVLVEQPDQVLTARRRGGPQEHPDPAARGHEHPLGQGGDRVERVPQRLLGVAPARCLGGPRRTRRTRCTRCTRRTRRTRPAGLHRGRRPGAPAPAEERPAVGLRHDRADLGGLDRLGGLRRPPLGQRGLDDEHVAEPHVRRAGGTRPPVGDDRAKTRVVLRVHEHSREHGVGVVVGGLAEHELGIAGHRHRARVVALVGEGHPAYGHVRLRADAPVQGRGDRAVVPPVAGAVLGEADLVLRGGPAHGQAGGRPVLAGLVVAQVDEVAELLGAAVDAPPGQGVAVPAELAPAGRGEREREPAVGQVVHGRGERRVAGVEALARGGEGVAAHAQALLAGLLRGDRHVAGRPLLQQQLARRDHRLGVEPFAQEPVVDGVVDRQQRHAVVVGHVAAHHGVPLVLRQAGGREVDGLVVAEGAAGAKPSQRVVVGGGVARVDHGGEARRVGGDDEVVGQAADEAEVGHAERPVLVGVVRVTGVVRRLGDAPRDAEPRGVRHLRAHDEPHRLGQQPRGGLAHDEAGHEVLEHRPRPRGEGRPAARRTQRPAEHPPVPGADVALGDREVAGQPGLGGQQVVAAVVELGIRHVIADRHQPAARVDEEAEVHRDRELGAAARDVDEPPVERGAFPLRHAAVLAQPGDRAGDGLGPRGGAAGHRGVMGVGLLVGGIDLADDRDQGGRHVGGAAEVHLAVVVGDERRLDGPQGGLDALEASGAEARDDRVLGQDLLQHADGVADAFDAVADGAVAGPRPAPGAGAADPTHPVEGGLAQGDEVPGEVAGVDGGDVRRGQRVEGPGVVPVEQVALVLLQPVDRVQRPLDPRDRLLGADPAVVGRRDADQHVEPDVRRRRAVRDDRGGLLLEVVGRQVVLLRPDEGLEEVPGTPCDEPQRAQVLGGGVQLGGGVRAADQPGEDGGEQPGEHERGRDEQTGPAAPDRDGGEQDRGDEPQRHRAHVEPQGVLVGLRRRGGGRPFEQVLAGHQQPDQGPADGVEAQGGPVREQHAVGQAQDDPVPGVFHDGAEVAGPDHPALAVPQGCGQGEQRRDEVGREQREDRHARGQRREQPDEGDDADDDGDRDQ